MLVDAPITRRRPGLASFSARSVDERHIVTSSKRRAAGRITLRLTVTRGERGVARRRGRIDQQLLASPAVPRCRLPGLRPPPGE
jgi:hypothetical protein